MFGKYKCKKEVNEIFTKYGFHPLLVEGSGFPEDFLMFTSYIYLMGNTLFLHPMGKEPESSYASLRKVFSKIEYDWCTYIETRKELPDEEFHAKMQQKRQEQLATYKEDLAEEYRKVLELEYRDGTVRFPAQITPYCSDTKVKSQYGNWEINYSPKIISFIQLPVDDSLQHQATLFAENWILKRPCKLVSVYFGREIPVSAYQTLFQMFSEIFRIMNAYQIQEFEEKKDDRQYQYRSDWNPAEF